MSIFLDAIKVMDLAYKIKLILIENGDYKALGV